MANISSYPLITPKAGDLILFTETYDINAAAPVIGNPTRATTLKEVAALSNAINLGYKSYTALVTQSGVTAPVATVLQDNIGGTFTWGYTSAGVYTITSASSLFTSAKTIVFLNGNDPTRFAATWVWNSSGVITVNTGGNGRWIAGAFEIRVYS